MNKQVPILLGLLLVFFAIWLLITSNHAVHSVMDRLNNLGYDLALQARIFTQHIPPSNRIAVIDIDDKSLQIEGQWPWPRAKMADLVDKLAAAGAAEIVFDIFFSEKQANIADALLAEMNKKKSLDPALISLLKKNAALFDDDNLFAKSLAANQSILALGFLPRAQTENVLPAPLFILTAQEQAQLQFIKAAGYISNIPIIQTAGKGSGFTNIIPDNDGIVRRAPMLIVYKDKVYPSLALQAVLSLLGEQISLITPTYGETLKLEGIQLGDSIIPVDENGQVFIPFIGKSYTFPFYSATDLLHQRLAANALLGKIVVVGTSATGLADLRATPIQSLFPGVEIQATLINGLLENNFFYKPAWTFGANVTITLLLGLLAVCLFPYLGPRALSAVIIIFPLSLFAINHLLWIYVDIILSWLVLAILVFAIGILNIIYGYLFETRRREKLREMFGQYLPKKHIDEMLRTKNYALRGEDREMSVLFADIRNFTTISEGMSATELVEMLNTLFTPMTEAIFKHHGTIDKYVGDLIMAFWGAPLKDKRHARHAIESALAMQEKAKALRVSMVDRKWPEIHIGIGINSGMMSVGDMGSRFRRNYTVIGDAVNLASRIEGLSKFYGAGIIVTEYTQRHQPLFVFRKLDRVHVKGKKASIEIYEVIGKKVNLSLNFEKELEKYQTALNYYFARDWDNAISLLTALQEAHPETQLYHIYIERIRGFKQHPPATEWDGAYTHDKI
ncbi:MAG TPA: adenylate/guanylate cyclase domain-containing protein [Gammaproteobacteria bacterium]|nr:adenylate/guanylate cyclase domain-containing protein [Gammaproteobacteria bacterium]